MKFDITTQDISSVENFIENGNTECLQNDAAKKFIYGCEALFHSLLAENEKLRKQNFTLQRSLDRYRKKEEKEIAEGNFTETETDSVDIAKCLLYCLQQYKTYKLTRSKFLLILYEAYCSWLGSKRERLCVEHPVATKYGPNFWRVYKHLLEKNLYTKMPREAWTKMTEENPGKAAFIENVAKKYYDYSEKELSNMIMKSQPITDSKPAENGDKWKKVISDSDIYVWKNTPK